MPWHLLHTDVPEDYFSALREWVAGSGGRGHRLDGSRGGDVVHEGGEVSTGDAVLGPGLAGGRLQHDPLGAMAHLQEEAIVQKAEPRLGEGVLPAIDHGAEHELVLLVLDPLRRRLTACADKIGPGDIGVC